jgi:hypothetical protein
MPSLRAILTRLLGRPTGTLVAPSGIDAASLAALTEGRLAPPFRHDAPAGSTCPTGWHLRHATIEEALVVMQGATRGRRRAWFRLPKRVGPISGATRGELFAYGQLLPDGQPATDTYLCAACHRAVISRGD